jgi:hypothetical protein
MIITEPGMVYLEIWVCRLGFWGPNVDGIYFSPLALLLKPNISVNKTKDAFFFVYFILFIFRLCLQGACELQSDKYKGLQMHCKE